jgi:hypothetical protein
MQILLRFYENYGNHIRVSNRLLILEDYANWHKFKLYAYLKFIGKICGKFKLNTIWYAHTFAQLLCTQNFINNFDKN